jgi:hypothetical protein
MAMKMEHLIEQLDLADDITLGRITGEALAIVSRRGINAWEELQAFVESMNSDERDELKESLIAYLIGEVDEDDSGE